MGQSASGLLGGARGIGAISRAGVASLSYLVEVRGDWYPKMVCGALVCLWEFRSIVTSMSTLNWGGNVKNIGQEERKHLRYSCAPSSVPCDIGL